jgi:hypothetical protein
MDPRRPRIARRAGRDADSRRPDGTSRWRPRRRIGLSSDQEAVLELQRLAGNHAVVAALARARSGGRVAALDAIKLDQRPSAPEDGLDQIRKRAGGRGVMGYTIRAIEDSPPLLRPEAPVKEAGGWTVRPRSVSYLPEPMLEEYWPTKGRHKIGDGSFLDVDDEWERKLRVGEDEHVADATLAWQLTWQTVARAINDLAKKPGPPAATPEGASRALWDRYRKALPVDLRPEGDAPSETAQRDVLAVRGGTFFAWLWETTIVRDTRGYHEPRTKPVPEVRDVAVNQLVDATSKIPGPTSKELIEELRPKYTRGRRITGSKLP